MPLYDRDLALIQAVAFGELAERAAPHIVALLRGARIPVRRVLDGTASRDCYRRSRELHHVALFDEPDLRAWLEREGFTVATSRAYGAAPLAPRRLAVVATRR